MYDPEMPHKPAASKDRIDPPLKPSNIPIHPSDGMKRTPLRYIPEFQQPRFSDAASKMNASHKMNASKDNVSTGVTTPAREPARPPEQDPRSTSERYVTNPPDLTTRGNPKLFSPGGISTIPKASPSQRSDLTAPSATQNSRVFPTSMTKNLFSSGDAFGTRDPNKSSSMYNNYWMMMMYGERESSGKGSSRNPADGEPPKPSGHKGDGGPPPSHGSPPRDPSGGGGGGSSPTPPPGGPPDPRGHGGGGGGSGPPVPPSGPVPPYPYPSHSKTFTMKPDLKLFPTLTDDSKFSAWYRQLTGVMMGTNVGEVKRFDYVPPREEAESFRNKCLWMFTVFDATVKTTSGRLILDNHRTTCDGRRVLRALCDHYSHSTSAQLRVQQIMTQLVNTPLTSSWNKPLEDYLSWFIRMVNQYNDTVIHSDDRLTPGMIRTMLERNVISCKPLAAVRTQELFDIAKGVRPLTLEQYVELLRSAAALADTQAASGRGSRRANVHEVDTSTPDDDTSPDTDVEMLDVYMANRNPAASMDRDTWKSLDKSTHTAWDQISPDDKAKILSYAEARAERRAATGLSNQDSSNRPTRSANVAVTDTPSSEDTDDAPSESIEANVTKTDTQRVNAAKGSAHPGDMRRFLGSPGKATSGKPKATASRAANTVRWSASIAQSEPHIPSGERGAADGSVIDLLDTPIISPSESAAPSSDPFSPRDELDLLGQPATKPASAPPADDPFGLESIWEEDNEKDFW